MQDKALYVYGVVEFGFDLYWREKGINGENVYLISQGRFSALVHDCEEKPYTSDDTNVIKELIIAHNMILDKAIENFGGVIPLHFNTIIKNGENSAQHNLKVWLRVERSRLEKLWNRIENKKEYGVRIYYEKDKLLQEADLDFNVMRIEESKQEKGEGLSYLLQEKIKFQINEFVQNKINLLKQEFYNEIKSVAEDVMVNRSRIFIDEEKDLLLSISVLVRERQINELKRFLERKELSGFSFNLAGPFAPYSFVENGTKQ